MICDEPAYMLVNNQLYHFSKQVDGKKLRPFLTKNHIVIPRTIEQQYYERFVTQLIAAYDVYAKGFEIRSRNAAAHSRPDCFRSGGRRFHRCNTLVISGRLSDD